MIEDDGYEPHLGNISQLIFIASSTGYERAAAARATPPGSLSRARRFVYSNSTMSTPFAHLHLHSQYSLLDGAIKFDSLFEKARRLGIEAVALTDHGNLFGAVEFYRHAKEAGVKPIIGCELYVTDRSRHDRSPDQRTYHLTVLAMDEVGYRNLSRLVTRAYFEGFYRRPRVDHELLFSHAEGLIVLSGCLSGELCSRLLEGDMPGALRTASLYREAFGDRYYLEIQATRLKEQQEANSRLLAMGERLGIPVVATNDCHYLEREDAKPHDILLCIQTGASLDDPKRLRFQGEEFYLKSREEMLDALDGIEEPLALTAEVAERCSFEFRNEGYKMPRFEVPGDETLDDLMARLAHEGLERRIAEGSVEAARRAEYEERLEREIEVIRKMGFSGYFLVVADFINHAKSRGIPVGPGRGSAAGSLVAYSLGITDVDPIPYRLLFERFLNPERVTMPDIDVDICGERRDEIIRYVTEKYGAQNVAQIGTFGTMSAKACVKDVGRVLGIPYAEVDRLTKTIPSFRGKVKSIEECLKEAPQFVELIKNNERLAELVEMARPLENMVRHSSTHAAGIVISNEPLMDYIPLYKGQKNEVVTQYDMNSIEYLGYVKFDFLGLKTLTVIDRTLDFIREQAGEAPDLSRLPLDDSQVYELLSQGRTKGVFQVESAGMVELLTRLQPTKFEDLVAVLALYRPGPLDSGMVDDFIARKHGRKRVTYPLPELKDILAETYGLFVYQEQIMNAACVVAGYTVGEADLLRRAMGKKKPEEMKAQRDRFIEGAVKRNIPKKKATSLFNTMEKFAQYSFNKSHSTAYALITYQTAYLKAHYPCEFMAALMSVESGNTDKVIEGIAECRELGIQVLPPDVNESLAGFTPLGGKIRFGLAAIKNIGTSTVESIIRAKREGGRFVDIFDFCRRVDGKNLNKRSLENLIKSGAFDSLGHGRAPLMEALPGLLSYVASAHRGAGTQQNALFEMEADPTPLPLPDVEEWGEAKLLEGEMEALGFYVSSHPLAKYADDIARLTTADSESIGGLGDRERVVIAGVPRSSKIRSTKNSDIYGNIVLEDTKGSIEVVAFGDVLRPVLPTLEKKIEPIVVSGVVEGSDERIKVRASKMVPLREVKASFVLNIDLTRLEPAPDTLDAIAAVLARYPGERPVFIHMVSAAAGEKVVIEAGSLRIEPDDEMVAELRRIVGGKGQVWLSPAMR